MYSSSTTAVITWGKELTWNSSHSSWYGQYEYRVWRSCSHTFAYLWQRASYPAYYCTVAVEEPWPCGAQCVPSCLLLIASIWGRTNQGVIYFQPNIYHSGLSFMSILNSPWNSYLASAHYVILSLCKEETWHLQSFSRIKTTALWQMRLLFAQTAWCIIIHLVHLQSFEDAVAE